MSLYASGDCTRTGGRDHVQGKLMPVVTSLELAE